MGSRYRRTSVSPSPASATDSSDPYAAYLSWVADGRPTLGGGAAVRPEEGTVLLSEHVQVQELRAIPLGPVKTAAASTSHGESLVPRASVWRRFTDAFRRPPAP